MNRLGPAPDAPNDPRHPEIVTPSFGTVRPRRERTSGLSGFMDAVEVSESEHPGASTNWFRAACPVVAGEDASPTVRLAWAADFTANGGNYLDLSQWSAINSDLNITLGRAPVGEWTGIATRAWYAHDGIGHARAELFDTEGFVGTCTTSLLVDEMAAPY